PPTPGRWWWAVPRLLNNKLR
ncbi:hypothetical protein VN97_g11814, partial [Penicillium thymicola]